MNKEFEKYKGIHPGAVLGRELDKRNLSQRPFALSLMEHPQTINAIIKGKRDMNTAIALKIESALDLEEGTLLVLQAYYDIKKEKQKSLHQKRPNIDHLRESLFWDTDINSINWDKQASSVIRRVFERGNISEKKEIVKFYGSSKIKPIIKDMSNKFRKEG
ncbi:helix-turn-helix transcriptional regulator [Flavobacterium hercynium]|uniref:Plasmid maintenance system antidote protein n=1 Tax=Flavobacterium hercynium TaxID=387094 RepID=A0A226HH48_9FLAO|nr:helix-turn-helix domain-containing protein [Flavobacterium hercynium]OXA93495.1 plasmid maintenance system antidote protein [Flavobacterium hercynium]SMP32026.1 addiction module antidote protein, HigA family [Flavobacterium hercynium]